MTDIIDFLCMKPNGEIIEHKKENLEFLLSQLSESDKKRSVEALNLIAEQKQKLMDVSTNNGHFIFVQIDLGWLIANRQYLAKLDLENQQVLHPDDSTH